MLNYSKTIKTQKANSPIRQFCYKNAKKSLAQKLFGDIYAKKPLQIQCFQFIWPLKTYYVVIMTTIQLNKFID